jgi:PII-like signaling protein
LHKAHLVRHDQPIVLMIVDSASKLSLLMPEIEELIDTGMMAVSDVRVVRVQKNGALGGTDAKPIDSSHG